MSDEKKVKDPLERLLNGEKITHTEKTRRGDFTFVFPLPATLRQIEVDVADMMGGRPLASFSDPAVTNMRIYATLSHVIMSGPEWWEQLESPEQCPDNAFMADLYGRYLQFYTSTQGQMVRGRYRGEVGTIRRKSGAAAPSVGGGALPDSADGPEVSKSE